MIRPQGGPFDRGVDVLAVPLLGPGRGGVAERRVERTAAVDLRPPLHRIAVDGGQDVCGGTGLRREAVPLVAAPPAARKALDRRVGLDEHVLRLERTLPVIQEARAAEQLAVERPVAVGVGRRVDRDDPAAAAHPALERHALVASQHARAVRLEQHDDVDAAQPVLAEARRVLGQLGAEPLLQCRAAGLDRPRMAVRHRAREDEHLDLRLVAAAAPGRDRQREDRGANPHARDATAAAAPSARHLAASAPWTPGRASTAPRPVAGSGTCAPTGSSPCAGAPPGHLPTPRA
jgi:hypothetical protein